MVHNKNDINLLASFIIRNIVSVNKTIDWCYAQYTDSGAPNWIERMTLATDKQELLDIIATEFNVYGTLDFEYQAGEIAYEYKNGLLTLYQAIKILQDIYPGDEKLKSEKEKLNIANDYYDWHDQLDIVAKKEVQSIFNKYYSKYADSRKLFDVKYIGAVYITLTYDEFL